MTMTDNSRLAPGGNNPPDYAKQITDQMARDYAATQDAADSLIAQAEAIPATVESDEQLGTVTQTVVALRDEIAKVLAYHKKEKEPFLRGGQGVDNFFFGLRDKLNGVMKEVGRRGDAFNQRKLAAERERRANEEREARRKADEAAAAARKAAREAQEAEEAARRARKPEKVDALAQEAAQRQQEAASAHVEAQVAGIDAEQAALSTEVKGADIARQRFEDSGRMATMKQVPHVEIVDMAKLPFEKLVPYLKHDHVLAAVKLFAKQTNHKVQMPGAIIEMRDATIYK